MSELIYIPEDELKRVRELGNNTVDRTAIFADVCRINTLYMIANAGSGHIGSSFSSLDIVSHLLLNEMDPDRDVYFSSKGHDAPGYYAALIGAGQLEFELVHQLRRLGGLPGHPDVSTPNVEANTGSLGMGISKAKGMALANRAHGKPGQTFVMTGDGELQEGQLWESLASAANQQIGEITAIVDHNKLQSDTYVSHVSDLGDLEAKFASFGWAVARCNGHDFLALAETLHSLRDDPRPGVLIADTIKGRGVSFMEHPRFKPDELYAFHSGAPSVEHYEKALAELLDRTNERLSNLGLASLNTRSHARPKALAAKPTQKLVAAYGRALVEQGRRNSELVVLDGDLVLDTGLIPFRDAFPDRFFECGIAEQDMVSQASGMALKGWLPAVHSFACFLAARPNEQIYNAATEGRKILYVGSLAGLLPGGPGHSHQSVRDIAALAAMPGLILIEPATEREVAAALEFALNQTDESVYLRLVTVPVEVSFEVPDLPLKLGHGHLVRDGNDALLISSGPVMLREAMLAAEKLRDQYAISLRIMDLPWLNRIDADWLTEQTQGFKRVFTLDNHYWLGGQGQLIASTLATAGIGAGQRVVPFAVENVPACGTADEVLHAHGLDAVSLTSRIASELGAA